MVFVLGEAAMRELGNWAWIVTVLLHLGALVWIIRRRFT
jgi:hypothetical protein